MFIYLLFDLGQVDLYDMLHISKKWPKTTFLNFLEKHVYVKVKLEKILI